MSQRQQKTHNEFTATFPCDTIQKWQRMIEVWNMNRKAPNPYVEPITGKFFCIFLLLLLSVVSRYINYKSST